MDEEQVGMIPPLPPSKMMINGVTIGEIFLLEHIEEILPRELIQIREQIRVEMVVGDKNVFWISNQENEFGTVFLFEVLFEVADVLMGSQTPRMRSG